MGTCEVKARKGLIRVSSEVVGGVIARVSITGDFMVIPEDKVFELEESLVNTRFDRGEVSGVVRRVLQGSSLVGCSEEDFVDAIMCSGEGDAA
ncbi:hypothetical protein ASAC_0547 [Acidilobus saccharovorans 345-15]|uniref:lipoate--protein ligase n=1 Tax=Acidilobus saccharovorans (strain DSM 16705 / JCM 18335 / VKM B-2471 / 345-15) TaxID=666510 RepID=D9Q0W6_ACIS3|nr:lipoate protein ligase C-terminal domain-containing protein [Acidilobus saccharovorans]ADL18954.1 hypothetical protein ASAC_0547 [Acidilobus saccharovorans 345-15]